jgi:hypothetical protein
VLRSHFKHSVELVDDNGEIVDQLAGVQDFMLARATYDAAVRRWPKARIRLCQEARIIEAAVSRIEQRGAVAFTGAGIAAVVILLIPCGGMCSRGRRGAWSVARSAQASSSSGAPRPRPGKGSSPSRPPSGRGRVRS